MTQFFFFFVFLFVCWCRTSNERARERREHQTPNRNQFPLNINAMGAQAAISQSGKCMTKPWTKAINFRILYADRTQTTDHIIDQIYLLIIQLNRIFFLYSPTSLPTILSVYWHWNFNDKNLKKEKKNKYHDSCEAYTFSADLQLFGTYFHGTADISIVVGITWIELKHSISAIFVNLSVTTSAVGGIGYSSGYASAQQPRHHTHTQTRGQRAWAPATQKSIWQNQFSIWFY